MSALSDLWGKIKTDIASPEGRAVVDKIEDEVLQAVLGVAEGVEPAVVRALFGPLIHKLAEAGITKLEHMTDDALKKLAPVPLGSSGLALTVSRPAEPALTHADTVADWPGPQE